MVDNRAAHWFTTRHASRNRQLSATLVDWVAAIIASHQLERCINTSNTRCRTFSNQSRCDERHFLTFSARTNRRSWNDDAVQHDVQRVVSGV